MKAFDYRVPATLDEAVRDLGPTVRALAGGTDLITLMKAGLSQPEALLSMRALLPRGIQADAGGITIGSGTTLAEIERDPAITERAPALSQACALAASQQLRNVATIGGNLLQRPRCWYFRNPHLDCWLKGGDTCPARDGQNQRHALFGSSPCVAVHPSDPAVPLMALDSTVRVYSRGGERQVKLSDFMVIPEDDRRTETTLREGEVILDIRIPAAPPGTRSAYLKAMDRGAFSFALVGVAVAVHVANDGKIDLARIALGGVAPIPWRAIPAERVLLGARPSEERLREVSDAALENATVLSGNAWKVKLAKALTLRALKEVLGLASV